MLDKKSRRRRTVSFQREVVDKMSALATAAFGLVAALAWNTAIQGRSSAPSPRPMGQAYGRSSATRRS